MCGQGYEKGMEGLSLHDCCWQHVPGWDGMWIESLLAVAHHSFNLSKLLGMFCSGVSGGSDEFVYLNVYKVIKNRV